MGVPIHPAQLAAIAEHACLMVVAGAPTTLLAFDHSRQVPLYRLERHRSLLSGFASYLLIENGQGEVLDRRAGGGREGQDEGTSTRTAPAEPAPQTC